jgi:acetyl-CoA carboxylase biotin carboxyl carrier protein
MNQVVAPMAGNVWKIVVAVGDQVEDGQDVAILESMKMEIPVAADFGGKVVRVVASEGSFVNEGDVLVELED